MKRFYKDIIKRIAEGPMWFDEHGVPRYGEFRPETIANIYAQACALVLIRCQSCGTSFPVAMSWDRTEVLRTPTNVEQVRTIHYGDPPNIECCPSGPTMNCLDLRVLQWWRKDPGHAWLRVPEFEIMLPDHPEFILTNH
jgi:hypothetical protein